MKTTRTPKDLAGAVRALREPRCSCGILLEGQYNNGEEHDECASCREGRLCDEAYESWREHT
jgi:hypothetical protein